jgi:hypothetical protein
MIQAPLLDEMLARQAAFDASRVPVAVPVAPVPVIVNIDAPLALQAKVQKIADYLPQLQTAVANIPGATAIPKAPP